jgi:hypothetical protein
MAREVFSTCFFKRSACSTPSLSTVLRVHCNRVTDGFIVHLGAACLSWHIIKAADSRPSVLITVRH